ncbi:MAG: hypothetical protein ACR2KQ_00925 [Actinomycetota bacterium]
MAGIAATQDRLQSAFVVLLIGLLSLAVGAAISLNAQVGFLLAVVVIGLIVFLLAPPAIFVLSALIAAIAFRGLVTLHVLPSVATFVDIPLVWGALIGALIKTTDRPQIARKQLWWIGLLSLSMLVSWAFHQAEVIRPVLYLLLLGEPFAVVAALTLAPPSLKLRRVLWLTAVSLVLVQVPFALVQIMFLGLGDHIQGTLYGAGAGAHTISAVITIGGIWWVVSGPGKLATRVMLTLPLFVIPLLADAKQVILTLPAMLIGGSLRRHPALTVFSGVLLVGAVVGLLRYAPAGDVAVNFLEQARAGKSGKAAAAEVVWDKVTADPVSFAFGRGPAQTVSRAAFMTTDRLLASDSPLRVFGLEPAEIATQADAYATSKTGYLKATSFNSGISSALGVLGDLGFVGLTVYLGLIVAMIRRLRRKGTPAAMVAAGGWAMFAVLGLTFDWWEQPPFVVFLGVISGLALLSHDVRPVPTEEEADRPQPPSYRSERSPASTAR